MFVAPTLGITYTTLNEAAKWGITTQIAESMGMRRELDTAFKNMKELKKRGVRVLPGGDYGFAWNPIGTNARDIEHFVNLLGFSPMDAILSATKLGGEIMMQGNELGQVKPGYLADMILVDGNPVANVKLLQDADKLLMIMKDGAFHKEPQVGAVASGRSPEFPLDLALHCIRLRPSRAPWTLSPRPLPEARVCTHPVRYALLRPAFPIGASCVLTAKRRTVWRQSAKSRIEALHEPPRRGRAGGCNVTGRMLCLRPHPPSP